MPDYDYTFKLLLLGDASVGKTSFTKRYCYNIFNPSERLTIGVDFHVKTIEIDYKGEPKKIKLQIWDIGGEERFRFLLPTYCLGANAAFLLYDITRPSTLENIPEWTTIVRQKGGAIPIMLVGAKIDLAPDQRKIDRDNGIQIAERNKLAGFVEISSKTGVNVDEAFDLLAELTLEKMESKT
ncbi:MAG: GTP-binding protein [Promethearchaeota archaeon]|nr:MAG: GTP-binding protein [Candidatus Lokiarchaeota archaeon]